MGVKFSINVMSFTDHLFIYFNFSPNMMVGWGKILAGTKCPRPSSYTQPYRLFLIQPCLTSIPAVQYSLICHVLNANFNVLPSHMLWKKESATVMLWLPSNPQLNKHRDHLQVGRHWDVCLSGQSTSLTLVQLTLSLSNAKNKRLQVFTTATSHCDRRSWSCCGWLKKVEWHGSAAFMVFQGSSFKVFKADVEKMSNFRGHYIKGSKSNGMKETD